MIAVDARALHVVALAEAFFDACGEWPSIEDGSLAVVQYLAVRAVRDQGAVAGRLRIVVTDRAGVNVVLDVVGAYWSPGGAA